MNFFGKLALHAVGVVGGNREVGRFASPHPDPRPSAIGNRYQSCVVAGNAAVIDLVTRDIRFGIAIPYQRQVCDWRVCVTVVPMMTSSAFAVVDANAASKTGSKDKVKKYFFIYEFDCAVEWWASCRSPSAIGAIGSPREP